MQIGYGIAFDLDESVLESYSMTRSEANKKIDKTLDIGCVLQGSFYISDREDALLNAFKNIDKLKSLDWFKKAVTRIIMFRMEYDSTSDFLPVFKDEEL